MIRVMLSRILQIAAESDPRVMQIAKDFKLYKETGRLGSIIGRDVDISRPLAAKQNELMHVHLFPNKLIIRGVPVRQHDRTSDIFLIYCEAIADPNRFLLIDIIWDDAHAKLNNEKYLRHQIIPIAEKFRQTY